MNTKNILSSSFFAFRTRDTLRNNRKRALYKNSAFEKITGIF